ncbi:DNA pilot protein [Flyfo microvirus Tbat2_116]|nr:DNA pilot protein [Flyfo microvirus Tbat2_116]
MAIWGTLGMQAASALTGGALGQVFAGMNDRRQLKQQRKLQEMQIEGNKEMIDYGKEKDLEMWHATNYDAQKKELKKAGLNPGLLYGMGGGGGVTTGGGGMAVSSGNAPTGGGEHIAAMGMSLESQLMMAQKKVLETQAEKNQAEANKTAGVDTEEAKTRIDSLTQGIDNQKAQKDLIDAQRRVADLEFVIKDATLQEQAEYIRVQTKRATAELRTELVEAKVSEGTINSKILLIKEEAIGAGIINALNRAKIAVEKATVYKIIESVKQEWTKIGQTDKQIAIQAFTAEMQANYPGIDKVIGRGLDDLGEELYKLMDGDYRPKTKETGVNK